MNIVFSHKGKEIANTNLNNRILEEIAGVAPGFDRLITIDGIIVSRPLRYKNVADMFDYACSGDKFVINGFAKDFVYPLPSLIPLRSRAPLSPPFLPFHLVFFFKNFLYY